MIICILQLDYLRQNNSKVAKLSTMTQNILRKYINTSKIVVNCYIFSKANINLKLIDLKVKNIFIIGTFSGKEIFVIHR